jgi:amino acid transporter
MEWIITLAVGGLALLFTAFAAWKSGRPRKDSLKPRWISWPMVTIFSGALLLLAVVHVINLMGITTGGGMAGGRSPL